MTESILHLIGVSKRFAGPEGEPSVDVLSGVDLEVGAGESLSIVGPSGSGKSTLLNIIGTLEAPSSGQVLFDGRDLAGLSPEEAAEFRNREIGFVFQSHHLLPQCSALENVLVPSLVHHDPELRRTAPARARDLLAAVGLAERSHHRPSQLSGGECQRVAVVRALVNRPRLVLADEPTGALDGRTATELGALLVDLNERESVALIVVTHSTELAERMGRRLELRAGLLEELAPRP